MYIVLFYGKTWWVPKNILNLSIHSSFNWSTLTSLQISKAQFSCVENKLLSMNKAKQSVVISNLKTTILFFYKWKEDYIFSSCLKWDDNRPFAFLWRFPCWHTETQIINTSKFQAKLLLSRTRVSSIETQIRKAIWEGRITELAVILKIKDWHWIF
jgi:hypothetical protein